MTHRDNAWPGVMESALKLRDGLPLANEREAEALERLRSAR